MYLDNATLYSGILMVCEIFDFLPKCTFYLKKKKTFYF